MLQDMYLNVFDGYDESISFLPQTSTIMFTGLTSPSDYKQSVKVDISDFVSDERLLYCLDGFVKPHIFDGMVSEITEKDSKGRKKTSRIFERGSKVRSKKLFACMQYVSEALLRFEAAIIHNMVFMIDTTDEVTVKKCQEYVVDEIQCLLVSPCFSGSAVRTEC